MKPEKVCICGNATDFEADKWQIKKDTIEWTLVSPGLQCSGALFRHEIAYVLGQMQHPAAVSNLCAALECSSENPMVRHEAAEALGSIGKQECLTVLQRYRQDEERVVKESCEVALDMLEYENSDQFQYADGLVRLQG